MFTHTSTDSIHLPHNWRRLPIIWRRGDAVDPIIVRLPVAPKPLDNHVEPDGTDSTYAIEARYGCSQGDDWLARPVTTIWDVRVSRAGIPGGWYLVGLKKDVNAAWVKPLAAIEAIGYNSSEISSRTVKLDSLRVLPSIRPAVNQRPVRCAI